MATKPLWEIFNAQRVDESLEHQTAFGFHDSLEFWNNDDRNYVDQTVQPAAAILNHVKEQYQRLKADPSESAVPQPSQSLQPYFDDDTAKDFLLELFNPEQAASCGPAFLDDCEIIYRNFGVTGGPKLLWVRAEYIRFKRYLDNTGVHAVIITGHPGIGKTEFLKYLLVARLRQQKPVLFHPNGESYFILYEGPYRYRIPDSYFETMQDNILKNSQYQRQLTGLWILLDSIDYKAVPKWAVNIQPKLIYSSSPQEKRWRPLQQLRWTPHLLVMNPYRLREAQLLTMLELETRGLSSAGKRQMFKLCCDFFEYSPGPRYFIDAALDVAAPGALTAETDMARYIDRKKFLLNAFYADSMTVLQQIPVYSTTGLGSLDDANLAFGKSNRIVLVQRDPQYAAFDEVDFERMTFKVQYLNNTVRDAVKDQISKQDRAQKKLWFEMSVDNNLARGFAGAIYEIQLKEYWGTSGMIALEAQTDHQTEISRAKTPTWYFKQSNTVRHVNIEVKKVIMDTLLPLNELDYNILYCPVQRNYPAIDFIIRDGKSNKYYGLSATIAPEHDINKAINGILKDGGVEPADYIHLFVVHKQPGGRNDHPSLAIPFYKSAWRKEPEFEVWVAWLACPLEI